MLASSTYNPVICATDSTSLAKCFFITSLRSDGRQVVFEDCQCHAELWDLDSCAASAYRSKCCLRTLASYDSDETNAEGGLHVVTDRIILLHRSRKILCNGKAERPKSRCTEAQQKTDETQTTSGFLLDLHPVTYSVYKYLSKQR